MTTPRKQLPVDWRDRLAKLDSNVTQKVIAETLGMSMHSIYNLRDRDADFNLACVKKIRKPKNNLAPKRKGRPPGVAKPKHHILRLLFSERHTITERLDMIAQSMPLDGESTLITCRMLAHTARDAVTEITTLREQVRSLIHEINGIKQADHMRRNQRTSGHANGGGSDKNQPIASRF